MARVFQVPNFGPPPAGTNTELERFVAQKHLEADLQVDLAKQLQEVQNTATEGGGGAPPAPPSGGQEGRPQSFAAAPRLESKDGGTRSTVTTAAR